MITITICGEERPLYGVDERWINREIDRRRTDHQPLCVRVKIRTDRIAVDLSTPGCEKGRGGRKAKPEERQVLELWERRGLNEPGFTGGSLIAFLKQLGEIT